jgi:hypothetical protein
VVETDEAVEASAAEDGRAGRPAGARTVDLRLPSLPVEEDHPGAVVYIPARFDPRPPIAVVVYLHGLGNCARNVIRAQDGPCGRDGRPRQSANLAAQLEASGRNALLVVPEVAFDQDSNDPGRLGEPEALRTVLAEVLEGLLPTVPNRGMADLGRLVVACHSAGYRTAAAVAVSGGLPISELHLLDALYGETEDFDRWVRAELDLIARLPPRARFASIYSLDAGTLGDSQVMTGRARQWLTEAGLDLDALVDDRTTVTWTPAEFRHGLLFKETGLSHVNVPRFYFGRLLATSVLPAIPEPGSGR